MKVVAGILIYKKKILALQRAHSIKSYKSLKYEFPGGKVKKNESTMQALRRELNEELSIKIDMSCTDFFSNYSYKYRELNLDLYFFTCTRWIGRIFPNEGQKIKWVKKNQIKASTLLPSNTIILNKVRQELLI